MPGLSVDSPYRAPVTADIISTLLLLALPASGKTEIRRYLDHLDPAAAGTLHIGPTVQLDDYPYVYLMRRISQELRSLGHDPVFFTSDDSSLQDARDWGTLIRLLNEDYGDLTRPFTPPKRAAPWLLSRLDRARARVGAEPLLDVLAPEARTHLEDSLESEAADVLRSKLKATLPTLEGHTVVIEFARGGPEGTWMPLSEPLGYRYSLSQLSREILAGAVALYVWVTPEECRRRNQARATPGIGEDASILHHGVPESVLRHDYGVDDVMWLRDQGGGAHLPVTRREGDHFDLPVSVFDNRVDQTSFLRDDPADWDPAQVAQLHDTLARLLDPLAPASR